MNELSVHDPMQSNNLLVPCVFHCSTSCPITVPEGDDAVVAVLSILFLAIALSQIPIVLNVVHLTIEIGMIPFLLNNNNLQISMEQYVNYASDRFTKLHCENVSQ